MTHPHNHYRERSCVKKRRYKTQASAQSATWEGARHVYRCDFCDGWHLASKVNTNDAPADDCAGPFASLSALRGTK